jgi:regulator of RNase E activity RraA
VLATKLPLWCSGIAAPASVNGLTFVGWNEPIGCGGCAIFPGDIIVADDDGAVCVPVALAEAMIAKAHKDHGWEEFSREKLLAGESLRRYYPLHKDAWPEYEAWLAERGLKE